MHKVRGSIYPPTLAETATTPVSLLGVVHNPIFLWQSLALVSTVLFLSTVRAMIHWDTKSKWAGADQCSGPEAMEWRLARNTWCLEILQVFWKQRVSYFGC